MLNDDQYIAGIGFSAGGLEPLRQFFDNTLHDSVTYVIVQHLPLNYRSNLASILLRSSTLKILEVEEGLEVSGDSIYVTPPSSYIFVDKGKFRVEPRSSGKPYPNESVDKFFLSLAAEKRDKAIGIILSGGGDDGLKGSMQIKANGGFVIAQEPATAEHSSMPSMIIEAGLANFTASPHQMPGIIRTYVEQVRQSKI